MAKYSRKYSREQTDGVDVALAISLGVYCAFAACFALGLYALLQPSRHPNSGLAAYKPPPAMVVTYLPSFRNAIVSTPAVLAVAETAKSETIKRRNVRASGGPSACPSAGRCPKACS